MILVALAALVVVGGFVGLSVLSTTDPEAVAESTSTSSTTPRSTTPTLDVTRFTVGDIAQGEPLQWGQVMAIDDGYPVALMEHAGSWFLFSTAPSEDSLGGGLLAWSSESGVDWVPLGQVIGPEHEITAGVSTAGNGLVALTIDETGSGPFLWRSENGAEWSMDPIELASDEGAAWLVPDAIGGNGEIYLISGSSGSGNDPIYDRLTAALGDLVDLDDYRWGYEVARGEITATVDGPLGIAIATYSAEELGLTALEREQAIESYSGSAQPPLMWRSTDGVVWEETAIEDVGWIDSITSTPTGLLLVIGYGPTGPRISTSSDGIVWEPSLEIVQPYSVQTWGDLLVGAGGGAKKPSVMVSADANLWESVGPGAVFPDRIQWHLETLGSGPGGIAAQVTGVPAYHIPDPPEHVVLIADSGFELSLDLSGAIRLIAPDGEEYVWTTGLTEDDAHVDLVTGEMVLADRETGEELARFGLEELRDAENVWTSQSAPLSFDTFVFSPDASTWTIQDFEEVAVDSHLPMLEVTKTHVIAVRVTDDFDPDSMGGFEVWAAEIP